MNYRHPLRRCSCLLAAARPAFLPRDRSLAASDPSCSSSSSLAARRLRRWRQQWHGLCRSAALRPRRLHRLAGVDQVRPLDRGLWRPGQRLHQPQRRHRAQRAARPARSATTGEAAAIPNWNGRTRAAMVGRVRRLDDGPFGRQRRATSRATAATAAISPRSTTASSRAAAQPSRCTRPTNIRPSRATSSAPARPARPGATPIRAPRGGASTTPPAIATSSPTCAAATCRRSAAT